MQRTNGKDSHTAASAIPLQHNGGMEDDTMTAALDDLLNGDPMDLLQWDEWAPMSAGSFLT